MLTVVIPVIYTTSGRMDGSSSVSTAHHWMVHMLMVDNYDINELWYEYEAKKKAAREEAQAAKAGGEPINVEA
jgi:hypothetical protein